MKEENAVTPAERRYAETVPSADEDSLALALRPRDVRARRGSWLWALAAFVAPFVVTSTQFLLALMIESSAGTSAAVLGALSPFSGALIGTLCVWRLPLSVVIRCVLGLACFVVIDVAMTFYLMLLLSLIHGR